MREPKPIDTCGNDSERLNAPGQVIPVFADHLAEKECILIAEAYTAHIQEHDCFPDIYIWPEDTAARIRVHNPSILFIDGLYPRANIKDMYQFFPGNPFQLRDSKDLYIVAGDFVPHSDMFGYTDMFGSVLEKYWRQRRVLLEAPPLLSPTEAVSFFAKQPLASLLIATLALRIDGKTDFANIVGIAALGDALRLQAHLQLDTSYRRYTTIQKFVERLTRPIGAGLKYTDSVEFRNALACVKLKDVERYLNKQRIDLKGPLVPLFGSGHDTETNVWNDDKLQQEIIAYTVRHLMGIAKGLFGRSGSKRVSDEIAFCLGHTEVYCVKETPSSNQTADVLQQIPNIGFLVSPTIRQIVEDSLS